VTTLERLRSQGQRLFAARSFVPIAILPLVVLAMPEAWRVRVAGSAASISIWLAVSLLLGATGLAIRAAALAFAPEGTSSRDTHRLRAPSLSTTGMYSIVRNPLYLGNALMWVGAVASLGLWWLVVITALLYWLYIERVILVEEMFLRDQFGPAFGEWVKRTPAFVPRLSAWSPATGAFSWRRLSSEHNGLSGFLLSVTLFSAGVEVLFGRRPLADWRADHWALIAALVAALALSVVVTILKRSRATQDTKR
jgi:protein-S-isoprenylcysteine O-methyltransferase Ste14